VLVRDLMNTSVASVLPATPVGAIVQLLAERSLPGVPVIDAGNVLLGLVTEADLLRRFVLSDEPQHGWLRGLYDNHDRAANRFARAHGATARDVMTAKLWTVDEDTTAEHAARLLEEHKVRRLPVLRDGRLVGMVSRADLLRALLPPPSSEAPATTSDQAIRAAISAGMRQQAWASAPLIFFDVHDGVVEIQGYHESVARHRALCTLVASIPGVARIVDNANEMPLSSMSA
jgi:CBS domain-containing protein